VHFVGCVVNWLVTEHRMNSIKLKKKVEANMQC
jgi:hypothetical protein